MTNYNSPEMIRQSEVMEAEVASEGRAHTSQVKTPGKRGRPAGAKNVPKYDAQGLLIPLKKDVIATKVPGKRGRPKGSKNDTNQIVTSIETVSQAVTNQDETIVLPFGA